MIRYIAALSVICLIGFSSCKKSRGSASACFSFSKSSVKVGDTVYLLNCSENYDKFIWYTPTPSLDSINKHLIFVAPAAGTYPFILRVGPLSFMSNSYGSASEKSLTLTVTN
jgi:hypothetical protein